MKEKMKENQESMRLSLVKRQTSFTMLLGLLFVLLLTACGSNTSTGSPSSSRTTSTTPTATQTSAKSAEAALLPMMTLVGQPAAKLVSGNHTFEVDGKIKNGDTGQHDVYVQATL